MGIRIAVINPITIAAATELTPTLVYITSHALASGVSPLTFSNVFLDFSTAGVHQNGNRGYKLANIWRSPMRHGSHVLLRWALVRYSPRRHSQTPSSITI
jgi:hypothetical protein